MQKVMKISRMSGLVAIVCVGVLASFGRATQEEQTRTRSLSSTGHGAEHATRTDFQCDY